MGKSTLVNALVGRKVSIVSDHPQTTRRRITGVVNLAGCQVVLLDLPGFQKPFDSLTRKMQATVDDALSEVDAALVLLNAAESFGGGDRYIAAGGRRARTVPAVIALNKIDLLDGPQLAARLDEARGMVAGRRPVLPVSALRGDGLGEVLAGLAAAMPPGRVYFPEGQQSDQPLELLIAELVREQALRRTRDEVPHAIACEVGGITERADRPLVEIEASLIVETESQKAIVVGKGGRVVKAIGSGARHEIEAILGVQVFLDLRVKVRKRWRRDERYVERLLCRRSPPRLLLYSEAAIVQPASTHPEAAACTPKNSPRPSITRCCAPTRPPPTSSVSAARRRDVPLRGRLRVPALRAARRRAAARRRRQGLHRHLLSLRRRRPARQGRRRRGRRRSAAPTRSTWSSTCRACCPASSARCASELASVVRAVRMKSVNTGRGQGIVKAIIETCYLSNKMKKHGLQDLRAGGRRFREDVHGHGAAGRHRAGRRAAARLPRRARRRQGVGRHPHATATSSS